MDFETSRIISYTFLGIAGLSFLIWAVCIFVGGRAPFIVSACFIEACAAFIAYLFFDSMDPLMGSVWIGVMLVFALITVDVVRKKPRSI